MKHNEHNKQIHEWMGECWHDIEELPKLDFRCVKCGQINGILIHPNYVNHPFYNRNLRDYLTSHEWDIKIETMRMVMPIVKFFGVINAKYVCTVMKDGEGFCEVANTLEESLANCALRIING